MKTLDEVIDAFEWCMHDDDADCSQCPYYTGKDTDCHDRNVDALYYLKDYKRYQNTPSRHGHMSLVDYFEELQKNDPLTWDELRQMEGKPVWVEALLYKQWAIIACVYGDHIRFEGANLYASECRIYMGEDNGWQAYRKERE